MGGNALKTAQTRRYMAKEYYEILAEILHKIHDEGYTDPKCPIEGYMLIEAYRTKESFGDLDLVIWGPVDVNMIKTLFNPNEISKNGNVVSFDYKELQIDFIFFMDYDTAVCAAAYFSWNDLGNFIGRTAHAMGFTYGHDGLRYTLRDTENPTHIIKDISITQDMRSSLEFLGYDYGTYSRGFDTKEEIFEFVTTSPYFHPTYFFLHNRNHTARVRDRKRQMYNSCVEYFKTKYGMTGEEETVRLNRDLHLQRAKDMFHGLSQTIDEAIETNEKSKAFRRVFNGDVYGSLFGASGKELGGLMSTHREFINSIDTKELISKLNEEEAASLFKAIQRIISN